MRKGLFLLLGLVLMFLPLASVPAASAAAPAYRLKPGTGMIDVWVFVDNDLNGIYSAGDVGLTDALACIERGVKYASCVGTDEGDTWWEDLPVGR